ncbi:MAG: PAS domain-containing sensor histidine kinase [Bacteroidaceae bacterium]
MIDLDSLMPILHEGVELYSPESGRLLKLNDQVCRMFGVKKEEFLESDIFILSNPNFPKKLKNAFKQKKQIRIKFPYSFDKVREHHFYKSKFKYSKIYIQCFGLPIVDDGLEEYALIMEDITAEWKQYDKDLCVAKEMANRLDKLKTTFIENVTHEVRTPLNAIVGFSQLIKDAENQVERDEYAEIISKNAEVLTKLVENVLNLSEIKAGYVKPRREKIDFSVFFNEVVIYMKTRLTNMNVHLIPYNPYDSFFINLDMDCVLQVTKYLVENTIKYIKDGYVKIGYRCKDKGFYIYIGGTGIEIPEERRKMILSCFEKTNILTDDVGIEFTLCNAILKRAGGKMGMNSEDGKGLTFWVWLPNKLVCK